MRKHHRCEEKTASGAKFSLPMFANVCGCLRMVEQAETMPDGDFLTSVLLWKQTQIPARAVSLREIIILSSSFSCFF